MNPIDQAAAVFEKAKKAESKATEARIAAEKVLATLMPVKEKGSVTVKGESYKVTIKYGLNRTIDTAALAAVKSEIPAAMFEQAIRYKPDIIDAGLEYLKSNEPDTYALLAQAITSKPAKPGVAVEAIVQADELREAA